MLARVAWETDESCGMLVETMWEIPSERLATVEVCSFSCLVLDRIKEEFFLLVLDV